MSRAGRTLASSQVPQSRLPPDGSDFSGREEEIEESRGDAPIPSSAVTSSTSRPNRRSVVMERRKSNVTFAKAPSIAPSDSISRVRTRETVESGHNDVEERRYSRATRAASQGSGSGAPLTENNLEKLNESPAAGTAAVEEAEAVRSDEQEAPITTGRSSRRVSRATNNYDGGRRASRASQRSSRQYMATVEDDEYERRGSRATNRRASRYSSRETDVVEGERRNSNATATSRRSRKTGYVADEGEVETTSKRRSTTVVEESAGKSGAVAAATATAVATGAVEEEVDSSKSRRQSVAVSRNAIDVDETRFRRPSVPASANAIDINATREVSREYTRSNGPSPSRVIASPPSAPSNISPKDTGAQSRRDSMSPTATQSSREVKETTVEAKETTTTAVTAARSASRPSSGPGSVGKSSSPTAPCSPLAPGQWEKKTRIITKRYPDGREVREREIRIQRCPAAA